MGLQFRLSDPWEAWKGMGFRDGLPDDFNFFCSLPFFALILKLFVLLILIDHGRWRSVHFSSRQVHKGDNVWPTDLNQITIHGHDNSNYASLTVSGLLHAHGRDQDTIRFGDNNDIVPQLGDGTHRCIINHFSIICQDWCNCLCWPCLIFLVSWNLSELLCVMEQFQTIPHFETEDKKDWEIIPTLFWRKEKWMGFQDRGEIPVSAGGPRPGSLYYRMVLVGRDINKEGSVQCNFDTNPKTPTQPKLLREGSVVITYWPFWWLALGVGVEKSDYFWSFSRPSWSKTWSPTPISNCLQMTCNIVHWV